ncbi:MAG: DUF748 domain-containing protein [Desulfobacteraceae bacterium]|nr:DUF748 domain-containing protein [Desulfobacteraceae bacterium]
MKQLIITWYRRLRYWIWLAAILVILYAGLGFGAAPMILKHVLTHQLSARLQRPVGVEKIRVNPFSLSVTLTGFAIGDKDGQSLMSAQRCYANAQLSSLWRRVLVVNAVEVNGLDLHLLRLGADHFNISDLFPATTASSAKSKKRSQAMAVVAHRMTLTDGRLAFEDRATQPSFATQWQGIQLEILGLDTRLKARPAQLNFAAASEAREKARIRGQLSVTPFSVQAQIELESLVMAKYAPYYQPYFKPQVAGGILSLSAALKWARDTGRIDPLALKVAGLNIALGPDQPLLALSRLELDNASLNFMERTIRLGQIAAQNGQIHVRRDAQGRLQLLDVVAQGGPPASQIAPAPDAKQGPAWEVLLDQFKLDGFDLAFSDLQPPQPVQIDLHQISAAVEGLSTRPETQAKVHLGFQWAEQGSFSTEGTLGLRPLAAELKIEAKDLEIVPLQPYLGQHLQIIVTSGKFNGQGTLRITSAPQKPTDVQYSGQAALNDCQAVGALKSGDLVKFKSLFLSGLEAGSAPLRLSIDEVSLTDFFNRLVLYSDGTINLSAALKAPAAGTSASAQSTVSKKETATLPAPGAAQHSANPLGANIRINTITLQGGVVDFKDQFIQPNVRVTLKELGGRISGLAAGNAQKADILLRGVTPAKIPFEISGKVNPFIEKPFLDLKMVFTDIDLSQFAPYSAKYLGYELDKGQLSLSLAYHLEENQLAGRNKIEVNQLTLGNAVESPQATKLPVKLAIALLKDADGDINLDFPVEGSVDDPRFSLKDMIFSMLGNLVMDIVRSPFKFLGSLFGHGEELKYVDFAPGQADITPLGAEKLGDLAKALAARPELRMDIQGQIDPQADTDALRQAKFERRLKRAKVKGARNAPPLDQVTITAEEKENLIQKAFKDATFPKPRDEKGDLKKLSTAEMEKLLITAIEINNDTLRQLALDRASAAKEYLVEQGQVAANRLFVVDPELPTTGENNEKYKSRVQFEVK